MLTEFKDRVAVITGAGSGFGREFALTGARRGMKLVLADIQPDALEQTQADVCALGGESLTCVTDVSDAAQVQALADACAGAYGSPQLLFNNAGVATGGLVWEHSEADWNWVLGVNLMGVVNGLRAFVPSMIQAGEPAHIVNTSSVAGLLSPQNMGVYNVSKHGVVTLSETLYHDLKLVKAPIGVSVLCPAFVPTGIADSERNRPEEMAAGELTKSMQAARKATVKAVSSGKITAAQVAEQTFHAIGQDKFYIVTHGGIMESVRLRTDDVAQLRNPTDPFALRRDVAPDV